MTPSTATLLTNAQLACGLFLSAIHLPLLQSAYAGLAMEVGVFVIQQWMIN
jgi:hypothetical protein